MIYGVGVAERNSLDIKYDGLVWKRESKSGFSEDSVIYPEVAGELTLSWDLQVSNPCLSPLNA